VSREDRVLIAAYAAISDAVTLDGAVLLLTPQAPGSPMLNRIVGLGVERPATEDDVDAALEAVPAGTRFYAAVSPSAQPDELPAWLEARGLEPGWGWMLFRRGIDDPVGAGPVRPSSHAPLRLTRVEDDGSAATFGRIVRTGYGLPESLEWAAAGVWRRGWECWLALDGDTPVGAAALFVSEGIAYLGFAATLAEHRGKGAQTALLAHRIRRAAELGCDAILTETGERRDDLPSNSYRNILRAGFEEVAVTSNWVGTRA
jgi:GNAT superfamily N-acetyltransferase